MNPTDSIRRVVCVTGTESTGKTTLAGQLAAALQVPLVPEIARSYLAGRSHAGSSRYTAADVLAIARGQAAAEREALETAPLVVADTDLTVIQVWWEEKFGPLDPWFAEALAQRCARLYLLPRPDLPWEFDPLRESPHDRPRLHQRYRQLLRQGPFPFHEVAGRGDARLRCALAPVQRWLG